MAEEKKNVFDYIKNLFKGNESNKQAIQNINRSGTVSGKASGVKNISTSIPKTNTDTSNLAGNNRQQALGTPRTQRGNTSTATSSYSNALGTPATNREVGRTFAPSSSKPVVSNPTKTTTSASKTQSPSTNNFLISTQTGRENANYYNQMKQDRIQSEQKADKQEAQTLLQDRKSVVDTKIAENPDYAFDLYQFRDSNGQAISGQDYKNRVDQYNNGIVNLNSSFKNLEDAYKADGDSAKYLEGYNELTTQANNLENERKALDALTVEYNSTILDEYERNKERMHEITVMTSRKGHVGFVQAQLDALNQEYRDLEARNEAIKGLVDDVKAIQDNDQYQSLLSEGNEKAITQFESYIASQNDELWERASKAPLKWSANMLSGVTAVGDIALDLLGETAGNAIYSVANTLKETGTISDEDFGKISSVAQQLRDFEYNNENNFSAQLREIGRQFDMEMYSDPNMDKTTESVARMIDGAIENGIRYRMLGENLSTLPMVLSTLGDTYSEARANGFSTPVALGTSILKAYITYRSEQLQTEKYFNMLGNVAGSKIDKAFFSLLVNNAISSGLEEFAEEGAEYIADWAVDVVANAIEPNKATPEFNTGDLLNGCFIAMGSAMIGGTEATLRGAYNMARSVPQINSVKEYKMFDAELQNLKAIRDVEASLDAKNTMNAYIELCERRKAQFEAKSATLNAIDFESDNVNLPSQEQAEQTYKEAMVPEARKMANEQMKADSEVTKAYDAIRNITAQTLAQKGIMMNTDEYLNLSDKARSNCTAVKEYANKLKANVVFRTDIDGDGRYNPQTGMIEINPNGELGELSTLVHELTHGTESSGEHYKALAKLVKEFFGGTDADYKNALNVIKNRYASGKDPIILDDPGAEREFTAINLQDKNLLGNPEFVEKLIRYNESMAYRIYQNVKNMMSNDIKTNIETAFMQAFWNIDTKNTSTMQAQYAKTATDEDVANGEKLKELKTNVYSRISKFAVENGKIAPLENQAKHLSEMDDGDNLVITNNMNGYEYAGIRSGYMTISKGAFIFSANNHGIGDEKVISLLKQCTDPYLVFDAEHGYKGLLVGVAENGDGYVAYLNPEGGNIRKIDIITGLYARDNFQNYLNSLKNKNRNFYINEKTDIFLNEHELHLPEGAKVIGKKSMAKNGQNVKRSEGLTPDQLREEAHYNTGNTDVDAIMNDLFDSLSAEEQRNFIKNGQFTYATQEEVEEDPDVQEEGLWVKEPEGDYIKIDDGYVSDGKTVAWKDDRIEQLVQSIKDKTFKYPDPAYKHVYALNLSPHDYIALSYVFEPLHNKVWQNDINSDPEYYNNGVFDPEKMSYRPTESIGYMYFVVDSNGAKAKIVAQEGNHRSIILDESGYSKMPILLFSNDNIYGATMLEGMGTPDVRNPNKKIITSKDYIRVVENNLNSLIRKYGSGAKADIQYSKSLTPSDLKSLEKDYNKAVKENDTEIAQEIVKNYAEDYAKKTGQEVYEGYHGTNAVFNEFLKEKLGSKNFLAESAYMGFFMAGSKETAESYTGLNSADMFKLNFDPEMEGVRRDILNKYNVEELRQQDKIAEQAYLDEALERDIQAGDEDAVFVRNLRDGREQLIEAFNGDEKAYQELVDRFVTNWRIAKHNGVTNYAKYHNEYAESEQHKALKEAERLAGEDYEKAGLERLGYSPNIKHLFAFMENPMVHDFKNEGRDVDFSALMKEAKQKGHDGVIFQNVQDGGDFDTIYAVFEPNQFKSADPVTYDDNGNVIPLSERFNPETNDIRYSKSLKPEDLKDGIINKETDNEFARIQEPYQKLSEDELELLRTRDKRFLQDVRRTISSVFSERVQSGRSGNNNGQRNVSKVSGDDFYEFFKANINYLKNSETVTLHDKEDYQNGTAYMSNDGLSGFYIAENGDLQSVFNDSGKPGFLEEIADIVNKNAVSLDCFQSENHPLAKMYQEAFGFKVASILDYNREILEDEHGKEYADNFEAKFGQAPVYFMVKTDADVETKHFTKDQYDEALAYRDSFINKDSDDLNIAEPNISDADDLNVSEKELDEYNTISNYTDREHYTKGVDSKTGVVKPSFIVTLDTTLDKTTHQEEIEDAEKFAGTVAERLDKGQDVQKAIRRLKDNPLKNGVLRAYYTAQVLYDHGEMDEFYKLAQWARDVENYGGKLIESTKVLYDLDDEFSRAVYVSKVQQNLIDEYTANNSKNKDQIENTINELFQKYSDDIINAKTTRAFRTGLGRLTRACTQAMPKSIWARLKQFRMLAMLSGVKTPIANAESNLAVTGLYRMMSKQQALLESALKKVTFKTLDDTKTYEIKTEDRRATLRLDKDKTKVNQKLAEEEWKALREDMNTKYDTGAEKIPENLKKQLHLDNKKGIAKAVDSAFDFAENVQSVLLSDAPFAHKAFVTKFNELAQARNLDLKTIDKKSKTYNRLVDDAWSYAEEVVSHDETAISKTLANITRNSASNVRINDDTILGGMDQAIKTIKEKANQGQPLYKFIDASMKKAQQWFVPFYKTNASLLKKSVQFSPLEWGQVYNDYKKVKTGKMDLVDMVEHMAKALTGTELYIMGAIFARLGWLKWDKDDEDYSGRLAIKVPGTDYGYTIDFLDPVSTTLAKGVALDQELQENGVSFETGEKLVKDYEDIFLADQLDMFSSTKDFFDTIAKVDAGEDQYGEYTLSDGATDTAFTILNSYIPAIVRDMSRMVDPAKKVVYDTSNKRYLLNRLINSTPFRSSLVDKKDATGNTLTYTQPFTDNDFFNRLLTTLSKGKLVDMQGNSVSGVRENPGALNKEESNAFSQMAKDFQFVDENGDGFSDAHWIRDTVPSNIYPGNNQVELNPEEKDTYGKTWTDVWTSGANYLLNSDEYKNLDYENQADIIYELQGFAREVIEADYCQANDLEMTERQAKSSAIRDLCTKDGKLDGEMLGLIALGNAKANKLANGGQRYVMSAQDEEGNTIKNSRQLYMRHLYEEKGVYDEVLKAIEDSEGLLEYADFGLGKTVVGYSEEKALSLFQQIYNSVFSKEDEDATVSKGKRKKKSSSTGKKEKKKKVSPGSVIRNSGTKTASSGRGISTSKRALIGSGSVGETVKPNSNFLKAYSGSMQKQSNGYKPARGATGGTMTCPKCGNRVSSGMSRCPICGTRLN